MKEEHKKICKDVLETWGKKSQNMMLLEEMAELQVELVKNMNREKDNIKEIINETADVYLMLEQLKVSYGIEKEVEEMIDYKVQRVKNRLEEWKEKNKNE